eukprot:403353820
MQKNSKPNLSQNIDIAKKFEQNLGKIENQSLGSHSINIFRIRNDSLTPINDGENNISKNTPRFIKRKITNNSLVFDSGKISIAIINSKDEKLHQVQDTEGSQYSFKHNNKLRQKLSQNLSSMQLKVISQIENVKPLRNEKKKKILEREDLLPRSRSMYYAYLNDQDVLQSKKIEKGFPNVSSTDQFDLTDEDIKCFNIYPNSQQIVFIKTQIRPLINILNDLKCYAELVLFTCLPEILINSILDAPCYKDLQNTFSYVLSQEQCLSYDSESLIIKDLSVLLPTRSHDQIIVVDCGDHIVEEDVSQLNLHSKYTGYDYSNLKNLKPAIKQILRDQQNIQ